MYVYCLDILYLVFYLDAFICVCVCTFLHMCDEDVPFFLQRVICIPLERRWEMQVSPSQQLMATLPTSVRRWVSPSWASCMTASM